MTALTNAALSGVEVELFLSEQFDQFLVGHAQRSYYGAFLKTGVRIHLYRKPTMLHSKYVIVDGSLCAIGSSNMDVRSFGLNYEITLIADDAHLVELLRGNDERNRERSRELTYREWRDQPGTCTTLTTCADCGARSCECFRGRGHGQIRWIRCVWGQGFYDNIERSVRFSGGESLRWGRAARTPPCAPPTPTRPWPRCWRPLGRVVG